MGVTKSSSFKINTQICSSFTHDGIFCTKSSDRPSPEEYSSILALTVPCSNLGLILPLLQSFESES